MKQKKLFKDDNETDEKTSKKNCSKSNESKRTVENTTFHKPHGAKYGPPDPDKIPKSEGYFVVKLTHIVQSTLDENKQGIEINKEGHTPDGLLGGMYSSGGSYEIPDDVDTIEKMFDDFLREKKRKLNVKYADMENLDFDFEVFEKLNYYFRFIPAKNFFVAIPDNLRRVLRERGFNFEDWYQKYRSVEGEKATERDIRKALEIKDLDEKADAIKGQVWGLESINKELEYNIKKRNEKARKHNVEPCFENLDQEMEKKIQEKVKELDTVVKEMNNIAEEIGVSKRTNTYDHLIEKYSQMKLTNMG